MDGIVAVGWELKEELRSGALQDTLYWREGEYLRP